MLAGFGGHAVAMVLQQPLMAVGDREPIARGSRAPRNARSTAPATAPAFLSVWIVRSGSRWARLRTLAVGASLRPPMCSMRLHRAVIGEPSRYCNSKTLASRECGIERAQVPGA